MEQAQCVYGTTVCRFVPFIDMAGDFRLDPSLPDQAASGSGTHDKKPQEIRIRSDFLGSVHIEGYLFI